MKMVIRQKTELIKNWNSVNVVGCGNLFNIDFDKFEETALKQYHIKQSVTIFMLKSGRACFNLEEYAFLPSIVKCLSYSADDKNTDDFDGFRGIRLSEASSSRRLNTLLNPDFNFWDILVLPKLFV
jgi:hypothetical protein